MWCLDLLDAPRVAVKFPEYSISVPLPVLRTFVHFREEEELLGEITSFPIDVDVPESVARLVFEAALRDYVLGDDSKGRANESVLCMFQEQVGDPRFRDVVTLLSYLHHVRLLSLLITEKVGPPELLEPIKKSSVGKTVCLEDLEKLRASDQLNMSFLRPVAESLAHFPDYIELIRPLVFKALTHELELDLNFEGRRHPVPDGFPRRDELIQDPKVLRFIKIFHSLANVQKSYHDPEETPEFVITRSGQQIYVRIGELYDRDVGWLRSYALASYNPDGLKRVGPVEIEVLSLHKILEIETIVSITDGETVTVFDD